MPCVLTKVGQYAQIDANRPSTLFLQVACGLVASRGRAQIGAGFAIGLRADAFCVRGVCAVCRAVYTHGWRTTTGRLGARSMVPKNWKKIRSAGESGKADGRQKTAGKSGR